MTIVAAVDRDDTDGEIVREARELAAAFDESLHVVHVLDRSTFVELERTSVEDTGESVPLEDIRNLAEEIATEAADEVAPDATTVGLVGIPDDELTNYVEENGVTHLVIGGRKRSRMGKALFGSDAQSILLAAEVPVVVVS